MYYRFRTSWIVALLLGAASAAQAAPEPAPADDRFAVLDADHDGRVSWEEFHAVNEGITRQGFDTIDANKDQYISADEWRAFSSDHGMGVAMPPVDSTLPARDAVPPSVPLVMPPAVPGAVAPSVGKTGEPAAPSGAKSPSAPAIPPAGKPLPPLIMPPTASGHAATPSVAAPTPPEAPSVPLITPPTPSAPSDGKHAEAR